MSKRRKMEVVMAEGEEDEPVQTEEKGESLKQTRPYLSLQRTPTRSPDKAGKEKWEDG